MVAMARFYFTSEQKYLAHWSSVHAAATPWLVCPSSPCAYIATGEPDALDHYMGHLSDRHVMSRESGQLVREDEETCQDTTYCGLNPYFRQPTPGDAYQLHCRASVDPP